MEKSEIKIIKGLVDTAKTDLYESGWTPNNGGRWSSNQINCVVIFKSPTRFFPGSYTVWTEDGKFQGNLNGPKGSKIGKPQQIYTPDQISFFDPDWKAKVFE